MRAMSGVSMKTRPRICLLMLLAVALHSATTTAQTFSVLYSFKGRPDGFGPWSGVVSDSGGNLYGTTAAGGMQDCGTVYQIDSSGAETILFSFPCDDLIHPEAGVILDHAGNIFGTAKDSSQPPWGGVFKLDRVHGKVALYHFTDNDGHNPLAGVIRDSSGNLYGVTTEGGGEANGGTIFRLSPSGQETVLYTFVDHANGPVECDGTLVRDASGNLFGTSYLGGRFFEGTVFKLDPQGVLTILHDFDHRNRGAISPVAGLTMDSSGTLYGTAAFGGNFGRGAVFKIDPAGNYSVLHSFTTNEGTNPIAGLVLGKNGNLFGVTSGWNSYPGTVFELNVNGAFRILHRFDISYGEPLGTLRLDAAGSLYGTTLFGGDYGAGTVFKITF
jgi:uncharacterized repeat protein (TIGR03803 family)